MLNKKMVGVLIDGYSIEAGVFEGFTSKYRVVACFGSYTMTPPEFESIAAMEAYFELKFVGFVEPI